MTARKILVLAASLVVLLTAIWLIVGRLLATDPHAVHQAYFVNDGTLEPCLGPGDQFPPLSRPEGELVWGVYYSCDGCKTRQLGYLQKYSPEAKRNMDESAAQHGGFPDQGVLIGAAKELWVRAPARGSKWYDMRSREGMEVTSAANCGAGREKDFGPCVAQDEGR
jgi:hypothetical protein